MVGTLPLVETSRLILAIQKYLSNDWAAEEPVLLKHRRKIAESNVPIILAHGPQVVSPELIPAYIRAVAEAPGSEGPALARVYLSEIGKNPGIVRTPDRVRDAFRAVENIEDIVRLNYLNEHFLGNAARIEGSKLSYEPKSLEFGGGEVIITGDFGWDDMRNLPKDVTGTAEYTYSHLRHRFPRPEFQSAAINPGMQIKEVIDAAVNTARNGLLKDFDAGVDESKREGFTLNIELAFPEGSMRRNELRLVEYTPRMVPVLEYLLSRGN